MYRTITVESEGYSIIQAGVAMTFSSKSSLDFNLELDDKNVLQLSIRFIQNPSETQQLKGYAEDGRLIITCTNFNSPSGIGTDVPIELASFREKKIFLHFWVYDLKTINKVDYCFFIEK